MKLKFETILVLCIVLSVGVSFAMAEDVPFFSGEKGFTFTEPQAHTVVETQTVCESPTASGTSGEGSQSAPVITCTAPDADGNVTYSVAYQSQGIFRLNVQGPDDYSWEEYSYLAINDYQVYDYTTGTDLSPNTKIISDTGALKKDTTVQLDDRAADVSTELDVDLQWGKDAMIQRDGQWFYEQPVTVDNVLKITAPADYDGLVLGLRVRGVSLEGYSDGWTHWDDFDGIQDWEFIRLADYAEYETLKKGSRGDAVRVLQQRLSDLGYLTGAIDGDFGPGTEKAISAFQAAVGLEATGIADHETQKALYADDVVAPK